MTRPIYRYLLIAFFVLFQLELISYSKPPKKYETEGLVYATFPGQPNPTKESLALLVRQARWDNGDLGIGNQQRLKLRFVRVDDQVTPKGTFTRYRVFAEGAPENKVYVWRIWQAGEEPKAQSGDIYVNGRGLLLTHRPLPEEESSLQVPGGEFYITPEADSGVPLRYDLASRDNQLSVPGTIVPRAVASVDNGCRLEVRIAQPNAAAVLLVADGFPLESKIPLVLESEGQTTNLTIDTDNGGHSIVAGFPYVPGKTQGNLKATAEGPNCLPSVSLPWGTEAQTAPEASPDQTTPASQATSPAQATAPAQKKPWYLPH
jgi:hypothetical protein